ncbi:MAG TPA: secretin N-terminal domain-containing protein, partial [Verrucomicrobiae bacterium]|nr:secretin N-terminal domain-containing protein [Verrucomicrobiae bacterium]
MKLKIILLSLVGIIATSPIAMARTNTSAADSTQPAAVPATEASPATATPAATAAPATDAAAPATPAATAASSTDAAAPATPAATATPATDAAAPAAPTATETATATETPSTDATTPAAPAEPTAQPATQAADSAATTPAPAVQPAPTENVTATPVAQAAPADSAAAAPATPAAAAPAAPAAATDTASSAASTQASANSNAQRDPNTVIPLIVMDEVPLTDAIKNLARQAGLNYMLDPKINYGAAGPDGHVANPQPAVTLRWENLTADQALNAVLNNYNLTIIDDPKTKIARITIKDPAAPDPLTTKIIQLKYAYATNLLVNAQSVLLDKRSKVMADARTSQLVVVATDKEMVVIDELVARLDTPTKQ